MPAQQDVCGLMTQQGEVIGCAMVKLERRASLEVSCVQSCTVRVRVVVTGRVAQQIITYCHNRLPTNRTFWCQVKLFHSVISTGRNFLPPRPHSGFRFTAVLGIAHAANRTAWLTSPVRSLIGRGQCLREDTHVNLLTLTHNLTHNPNPNPTLPNPNPNPNP